MHPFRPHWPPRGHASGRVSVTVLEDLLRRLADWRREQPGLPSVSEAIHRMIEAELVAAGLCCDNVPVMPC